MPNIYKLILSFSFLFLAQNLSANGVEVFEDIEVYGIYEAYECTIDNVYVTGSGRSTDRRGGKLLVTISNENVEIKSTLGAVDSGSLQLIVKSEYEIIARSETMLYIYGVMSHKFTFHTGNGQSKFRGGVGHVGQQIQTTGSCAES